MGPSSQSDGGRAEIRQRMRRWAGRTFTENLPLKLTSLLVAVGVWAWLQREQVVMDRARARIEYTWPEDLVLVNDITSTALLNIRGPQGVVRTLDSDQLYIPVDLSDLGEGVHTVDFTDKPVRGLPSGVQVVQVTPIDAQAELDQALTREVPVRPVLFGQPAEGYKEVSMTVEPEVIEISGPQSLVRNITEVKTEVVDISGIRETRRLKVRLDLARRSIRPVTPQPVNLTIEIEPIVETRSFDNVPVTDRAGAWDANPVTARVEVEGPVDQLNSLDPSALSLLLHLPTPTPPGGSPLVITWRPDDPLSDADGGVQLVLPPGASEVVVTEVSPARFTLEPE